jgi:S-adenosylmethionine:tRNA-ribosyltransferase-isomerase (queuine synthetase)
MNKNKVETKGVASKVVTFRLPYQTFEEYENYCIEDHIFMSELLQKAVLKYIDKKGREKSTT